MVLFRGKRIVAAEFRAMLYTVSTRTEELLWGELMGTSTTGRSTIALDDLVDDVTFTKCGFSFLDDRPIVCRTRTVGCWRRRTLTRADVR